MRIRKLKTKAATTVAQATRRYMRSPEVKKLVEKYGKTAKDVVLYLIRRTLTYGEQMQFARYERARVLSLFGDLADSDVSDIIQEACALNIFDGEAYKRRVLTGPAVRIIHYHTQYPHLSNLF